MVTWVVKLPEEFAVIVRRGVPEVLSQRKSTVSPDWNPVPPTVTTAPAGPRELLVVIAAGTAVDVPVSMVNENVSLQRPMF
jgi:hypothetical protein